MKNLYLFSFGILLLAACGNTDTPTEQATPAVDSLANPLIYPQEVHFKNMRQLTFGGDNAEAYWSFGNDMLVFQATNPQWGVSCDQIYVMKMNGERLDSVPPQRVSTGLGRTTCAFFMPGDTTFIYASTHLANDSCPPVPERKAGRYVWPIYNTYDIFEADLNGNIIRQLTNSESYDAEATVSPKGDKIVFTSMRSGDLELYTMNIDGSDLRQITSGLGYDGGAFFSPDGSKLIWRASRPTTDEEIAKYKGLLDEGLVEPTNMELFIANVDGSEMRQLTQLGKANWAPYFHPSGEKVLFASNHASEAGFPFNIYMINLDGSGLEQITFDNAFDSFPMFSFDGKYLAFSSNRNNGRTRNTNMFIAEWVD
jgi:Tol biopolymer transport system component